MKNMVLPINMQNEFIAQLNYALPLCVLLADEHYKEWFYENYVEFFIVQQPDKTLAYGIFDSLFYAWRDNIDSLIMIFSSYHKVALDYIDEIYPLVKHRIDREFYCILFLDEYCIPCLNQPYNNVHEFLIYGYDDEAQAYKAIAFQESIFRYIDLEYADVQRAYVSAKEYIEARGWSGKMLMTLRTVASASDEAAHYPFDLSNFLEKIGRYAKGQCRLQDAYLFFQYPQRKNRIYYYGAETGKAMSVFFSSLLDLLDTDEIEPLGARIYGGYNSLHMLCEHRKGLLKRLLFVQEHCFVPDKLCCDVSDYELIVMKYEKIRLLYLKLQKYWEVQDAVSGTGRIKKTIQNLIVYMDEVYTDERGFMVALTKTLTA